MIQVGRDFKGVIYPNGIPRILDYDLNLGEKKPYLYVNRFRNQQDPSDFSGSALLHFNEGLGSLCIHFLRSNYSPITSVHLKYKELICI